jgi:hypothetical protein
LALGVNFGFHAPAYRQLTKSADERHDFGFNGRVPTVVSFRQLIAAIWLGLYRQKAWREQLEAFTCKRFYFCFALLWSGRPPSAHRHRLHQIAPILNVPRLRTKSG